jgi:hypothetical protein
MTDPGSWDADADLWQAITNEVPIPPRHDHVDAPEPIPVTARIHWERDGEEQLDTQAVAWSGRAVLISIHDRRRQILGVWLDAADITRR